MRRLNEWQGWISLEAHEPVPVRTHVRGRGCVHAEVARGIAFNVVALRCTWPGHAIALLRNWQGWSQQYRGSCDRYEWIFHEDPHACFHVQVTIKGG